MQITKDMNIVEVVNSYPRTAEVFQEFGMHCFGWMAARFENIEQGALAHGINVDELIEELNKVVE